MYNIIIIFTVSCNIDYDKLDRDYKIVPDFDIIQEKDDNYFSYNLRHPKKVGQLKVSPEIFFKSLYDCSYRALPELNDNIDYRSYKGKVSTKMQEAVISFKSIMEKYNVNYEKIKKNEIELVEKFEKSYKATEDAYKKVIEYENQPSDENKKSKEEAIKNYLNNQMSEVSSTISNDYCKNDGHKLYMYKNYEIYAHPTDTIYYCSNILQAEYDALQIYDAARDNEKCLSIELYYDVIFLYLSLEMVLNGKIRFSTIKNDLLKLLAHTVWCKKYKDEIDKMLVPNDKDEIDKMLVPNDKDDGDISEKLKSEFVVNNENYMSFLVRMKMLGNIAFYEDSEKYIYNVGENFTPYMNFFNKAFPQQNQIKKVKTFSYVRIDIHTELSEEKKITLLKN